MKMPRYFPSKKVFVVGVLAIVLLAWAVAGERASKHIAPFITDSILRTAALADSAFPDADADGLYDWEEGLSRTDAENPDSNNNGISDGDEIGGANLALALSQSDSIHAAFRRFNADPNTVDPTESLTQTLPTYVNPYSLSDIRLVPSEEMFVNAYYLSLLIILNANSEFLAEDPFAVISVWLESGDVALLDQLRYMGSHRKTIASDLIKINVPSGIETAHLSFVNSLYLEARSLEDVEKTSVDPMAGFFASVSYANQQIKRSHALEEVYLLLNK